MVKVVLFESSLIDYEGLSQPTWQNFTKEQIKCWGICNTNYDVLLVCNSNADKIYHKERKEVNYVRRINSF